MRDFVQQTHDHLATWSQGLMDGTYRVRLAKTRQRFRPGPNQHVHDVAEIFLQLSGKNHFTLPDAKLVLHEGECLLMPAGVPHAEAAEDGTQPFQMLVLGIASWQRTFIYGVKGPHTSIPVVNQLYCTPTPHPRGLNDLLASAEQYLSDPRGHAIGIRLMGVLLEECMAHLNLPTTPSWTLGKHDLAGKAAQMVQARFRQPDCNVAAIARELGVTPNYLSATYCAQTGVRLSRHLLEERLGLARTLLEESELKIVDIAARCGFSSPSIFIARFKAHTGHPPLQYRKRLRGE
jgi:AraC-like DNA-binding protein/mannose-6-phosphate isomerase-like protein (cupin superfamily)